MTSTATVPSTTPAASSGVRVQDVHKEYPTPAEPLVVLRGVTFSLDPGESLAIIGPSGSGKSTLLNILGTLDPPTRGSISIGGADPFALSPNELAHFRSRSVGFVFQDHHLLPQLNAVENVLIPALAAGKVNAEQSHRAEQLLQRVGLNGRSTHLPAELSGGERQRVAIARALINRPTLLLCDEPTGNLDPSTSHTIADMLFALAAETNAVLIAVTHSADFAGRFGRKMRMTEGRLVDS